MRIGFIATRLRGTDGVSLEVEKWTKVLRRMGHAVLFCAGELGGYAAQGVLIPELFFGHPKIQALNQRAFGQNADLRVDQLLTDIDALAGEMRPHLEDFISSNRLDLIIVQNALAIPMNLPLGICLTRLIADLNIPALAHNHDFYWERPRYQTNAILDLLDSNFPPKLPSLRHVTINTIAQQRLQARLGIGSVVIPNVYDFATPPPVIDDYNRDFRQAVGLTDGEFFILQPTRVIKRKGIEMAIELVHRLGLPSARLIISHQAGDEGLAYWNWLRREAQVMGVHLELVDQLVGDERVAPEGRKVYSLGDAYLHADLVTYPSIYEGFGNALLEAVYFKRPIVVNRYPVYNADIRPLGFQFIELDGFVDSGAVEQARHMLTSPGNWREMVKRNYEIARQHFSLEALEQKLKQVLASFSDSRYKDLLQNHA